MIRTSIRIRIRLHDQLMMELHTTVSYLSFVANTYAPHEARDNRKERLTIASSLASSLVRSAEDPHSCGAHAVVFCSSN